MMDWENFKPKTCVYHNNFTLPNSTTIYVYLMLHIMAIYDISEEQMEFGMQILITEAWQDPFIDLTKILNSNFDTSESFPLPDHVWKCIWHPDTIFLNAKRSSLYSDTLPNTYCKFLVPFGFIFRSSRYKLTISCNMDFHLYPMDTQLCHLDIIFLSSSDKLAKLLWYDLEQFEDLEPIKLLNEINPLNFEVKLLNVSTSQLNYSNIESRTILRANFLFARSLTASLVNTFTPSFLIVCLSMVSFWLEWNAVPGRVTLGVTAILTLCTQMVHARSSLPTLDYITAMDIWLLGCMFLVFMSLMEFTVTQTIGRHLQNTSISDVQNIVTENPKENVASNKPPNSWLRTRRFFVKHRNLIATSRIELCIPKRKTNPKKSNVKKDLWIDRASRIVFPMSLFVYCLFYWFFFIALATIDRRNILKVYMKAK